jgi:adenosylmethionine-8-amino-7-oxononanoate aminotransferase
VDGVRGDHVLLAPPYIASPDEIDLIVDKLGTAVDNVLRSVNQRIASCQSLRRE